MNSDWSVIWPGDGEDKTIALVKLFAMVTLSLKVTWYALRWLPGKVNPIVPFKSSPPTNRNIAQIFLLKQFFFCLPSRWQTPRAAKERRAGRVWRGRAAPIQQLGEGWRQSAQSLLQYVFTAPGSSHISIRISTTPGNFKVSYVHHFMGEVTVNCRQQAMQRLMKRSQRYLTSLWRLLWSKQYNKYK